MHQRDPHLVTRGLHLAADREKPFQEEIEEKNGRKSFWRARPAAGMTHAVDIVCVNQVSRGGKRNLHPAITVSASQAATDNSVTPLRHVAGRDRFFSNLVQSNDP